MRQRNPRSGSCRAALLIAAAGLASGCGGTGYEVAPVSGRITLDGEPLSGARIRFQPVAFDDDPNVGPGSYATTDEDGRYDLRLVAPDQPGAVVGKHRVRIRAGEKAAKRLRRAAGDGTLEYVVPTEGTTEAHFALQPARPDRARRP